MDKIPLLKQRHQCYDNIRKILCLHFLFLFFILFVISFQLIIMLKSVYKIEGMNLQKIINNTDFDYLQKTIVKLEKCLENQTCIKNFIEEI